MSFTRLLRHYWHESYYAVVSTRGVHFAQRCKDVTESIDLGKSRGFRFWLHLSLCQTCKDYFDLSEKLGQAARKFFRATAPQLESVERLNRELLRKFSGG